MKELPDSTKDKSVIRLLRNKFANIRPFDNRGDHDFIRRFMENYYTEKKEEYVISKMDVDNTRDMFMSKNKKSIED